MTVRMIGFGCTKNTGNYENIRVYMEVELHDADNFTSEFDALRNLVASEANLSSDYFDLRQKVVQQKTELADLVRDIELIRSKLDRAREQWSKFSQFLTDTNIDFNVLDGILGYCVDHLADTDCEDEDEHDDCDYDLDEEGIL